MRILTEEWPGLSKAAVVADTPIRQFLSFFCEDRVAVISFIVLMAIMFIAFFAPMLSPQNPYDLAQLNLLENRLPPGSKSSSGFTYWLGSDDQGRDLLSAIFYGLRTSIYVGVLSGLIALGIGMCIGLVAAYVGGRVDTVIMRIVDLQLSFPPILVALMLLAILGQGVGKIIFALVVVQWAYFARTVRASALVERSKEYIEAVHCLALSHRRIVFRHLLPNCLAPLIVVGTLKVAHAITLEATLSFLGIGLPVTKPSLGLLIAHGFDYMMSGRYWISFFPGIALSITIVAINLVGDQMRDALNPRLQR